MPLPSTSEIQQQVQQALAEDIGAADVTAALIADEKQSQAHLICRENAVLCGQAWFNAVFHQLNSQINIEWLVNDGENLHPDQLVCRIQGKTKDLLTGERAAMNFLQTLSATATTTQQYVDKIKHTKVRILDTRKTLPMYRLAQKYAVTCGGGHNHRMGLYDAILIKENHIQGAGSIANAVLQAKKLYPELEIQTEVENLEELKQAIHAGVDRVLLDNFSLDLLKQAVTLNRANQQTVRLEASGNITLERLANIAATGIDDISIGALTKHIQAVDFSMRLIN